MQDKIFCEKKSKACFLFTKSLLGLFSDSQPYILPINTLALAFFLNEDMVIILYKNRAIFRIDGALISKLNKRFEAHIVRISTTDRATSYLF